MMEECENKEHDNNENETDDIINTKNEIFFLYNEEGEESTNTESSNSEKFDERFSRGKVIIPNVNIEDINEGGVYDEIHDNIGGSDHDSV